MCRSVYLSGLLMSHGTDSVRTRRATIRITGKKAQRNNEAQQGGEGGDQN